VISSILVLVLAAAPPGAADPYETALAVAIHHFAREGSLDHIKAILDKHPRLVDAYEPLPSGHKPYSTDGYTPLDWAAARGHVKVAAYLIERGANVNSADGDGWTPLLLAARHGHLDVVTLLVEHGARLDAKTEAIAETSSDSLPGQPAARPSDKPPTKLPAIPARTALDWAAAFNHADVVAYLQARSKGAK
jgi:ankyrin repeat protein